MRTEPRQTKASDGFSLIELLVVIAIIGILASLMFPAISRSKERAKVTKVHVELRGLGMALEMYAMDFDGALPPVRVDCNANLSSHWCRFPKELAELDYLPRGSRPGMEVMMEDVFDPGHTYKYARPGPCWINGTSGGTHRMWIPDDFPVGQSRAGGYASDPDTSPVRWALWSQGPDPGSRKSNHRHAPLGRESWYEGTGDQGLIVHFANQDGLTFQSP